MLDYIVLVAWLIVTVIMCLSFTSTVKSSAYGDATASTIVFVVSIVVWVLLTTYIVASGVVEPKFWLLPPVVTYLTF